MDLAEVSEEFCCQIVKYFLRCRDFDLSRLKLSEILCNPFIIGQDFFRIAIEDFTGLSQHSLATQTFKEFYVELAFKTRDVLADSWLGDMQLLSSLGKTLLLDQCDKNLQAEIFKHGIKFSQRYTNLSYICGL